MTTLKEIYRKDVVYLPLPNLSSIWAVAPPITRITFFESIRPCRMPSWLNSSRIPFLANFSFFTFSYSD